MKIEGHGLGMGRVLVESLGKKKKREGRGSMERPSTLSISEKDKCSNIGRSKLDTRLAASNNRTLLGGTERRKGPEGDKEPLLKIAISMMSKSFLCCRKEKSFYFRSQWGGPPFFIRSCRDEKCSQPSFQLPQIPACKNFIFCLFRFQENQIHIRCWTDFPNF